MTIPNNRGGFQSVIGRFDPVQNSWTKLGNLKVARSGHFGIQAGNEFIMVGGLNSFGVKDSGLGNLPTESCKFNGQSMICTTREPSLKQFTAYPELMLLP